MRTRSHLKKADTHWLDLCPRLVVARARRIFSRSVSARALRSVRKSQRASLAAIFEMTSGTACLVAVLVLRMGVATAEEKGKAPFPPAPLTEAGKQLEAHYAERLKTLKAELGRTLRKFDVHFLRVSHVFPSPPLNAAFSSLLYFPGISRFPAR